MCSDMRVLVFTFEKPILEKTEEQTSPQKDGCPDQTRPQCVREVGLSRSRRGAGVTRRSTPPSTGPSEASRQRPAERQSRRDAWHT